MPGRGPQTFKKRQKEQQRRERQQEKMEKRLRRKEEAAAHPGGESVLETPLTGPLRPDWDTDDPVDGETNQPGHGL